jgi:hypothetical protein
LRWERWRGCSISLQYKARSDERIYSYEWSKKPTRSDMMKILEVVVHGPLFSTFLEGLFLVRMRNRGQKNIFSYWKEFLSGKRTYEMKIHTNN